MKEQLEKQEMKTSHAYYICWYIADEDNETYKGNVTGVLKMKYVISQMQASGISPYVVSLATVFKWARQYNTMYKHILLLVLSCTTTGTFVYHRWYFRVPPLVQSHLFCSCPSRISTILASPHVLL